MIWYLDDGYYGRPLKSALPPRFAITAKGYRWNDLVEAVKIINNNLGLSLKVKRYKHVGRFTKVIAFNKSNTNKVSSIWNELAKEYGLPQCMLYKLRLT